MALLMKTTLSKTSPKFSHHHKTLDVLMKTYFTDGPFNTSWNDELIRKKQQGLKGCHVPIKAEQNDAKCVPKWGYNLSSMMLLFVNAPRSPTRACYRCAECGTRQRPREAWSTAWSGAANSCDYFGSLPLLWVNVRRSRCPRLLCLLCD